MPMGWFYGDVSEGGRGPYTWDELKAEDAAGRIDPGSFIWRETGQERIRAWSVPQLKAALLSNRQLQDEESYILIGDVDDDDEDFDGVVEEDDEEDLARKIACAATIPPSRLLQGHEGGVSALAFQPGCKPSRLASGGLDATIRLWDLKTGAQLSRLEGHRGRVLAIAFSPNRPLLASASDDGTVRLWDLTPEAIGSRTWEIGASVTAVAFSPDGATLVTGGSDGAIRWWDVASGEQIRLIDARDGIEGLGIAADGTFVVSTHAPKGVRIWSLSDGEMIGPIECDVPGALGVCCSRDSRWIAATSNEKSLGDFSGEELGFKVRQLGFVSLWDVGTLTERRFQAHDDTATAVAFSRNGEFLVSTGGDGAARIWDASRPSLYATLRGTASVVLSAQFSPSGKFIVVGDCDGTIQVYETSAAYLERGEDHLRSGRLNEALADFEKAVRFGSQGVSSGRSRKAILEGRPRIRRNFQEAIRPSPDESHQPDWLGRGFEELGSLFEDVGNSGLAAYCLRYAAYWLKIADGREAERLLLEARAHFLAGGWVLSHTAFNSYLATTNDPQELYEDDEQLLRYGLSCLHVGDLDAAIQNLELVANAEGLAPDLQFAALYGLGKAHLAQGEEGEAARRFAQACRHKGRSIRRWKLEDL